VYIPYYICEVVLEAFIKTNTKYEFYSINILLEPTQIIDLKSREAILYVNYFGIKNKFVKQLANTSKDIIIDNTQAFFDAPIPEIDTFYSCRKFFGVPDGAYLSINKIMDQEFQVDNSLNRLDHLFQRIELNAEEGYASFKEADRLLMNQPIKQMSKLTHKLMKNINYEYIKKRRLTNYNHLHEKLNKTNKFTWLGDSELNAPLIYPYLSDREDLKHLLIKDKVFVATYWPNIYNWVGAESMEYELTSNLVCIPIDQRYTELEMEYIVNLILS
jgi:hypothetical protein